MKPVFTIITETFAVISFAVFAEAALASSEFAAVPPTPSPIVAPTLAPAPKTEMKLAKKKIDRDREAKDRKAETAKK